MPVRAKLSPSADWIELRTSSEDWDAADPALTGEMLAQMHLIRAFEETVLDLAAEGLVHGPAHASIGQEGGAVGSILALRPGDKVNGSHRGHHQFLSKALSYVAPALDPRAAFSPSVEELLFRTLAEILGLKHGYGHGRGGSMHLRWAEAGALGTNAIVGGGAPLALGAAMAEKLAGTGGVAVTYFGDGAANIGSVLESLNLASAWSLPVLFFVENNLYAVATRVDEVTRDGRLSARGAAFGIPSWRVDGMDPLAVHLATREALALLRAGKGPALIEAEVYRYFHQNGPLPGSAFGYRSKEEENAWRARDPLERTAAELVARRRLRQAEVEDLRGRCTALTQSLAARLVEPHGNARRIRPDAWPDPAFVDVGVRGEPPDWRRHRTIESEAHPGPFRERKFVDVIADVLNRRFAADSSLVIIGEDIHRLKGGTNGATRGLAEAFPGRVFGAPISEAAFTGLAGGLAMSGRHRAIVELMYADFVWVAADQVFNQIGKARHMFGGDADIPLVLRTKIAMGTGYGSQHSLDPAGLFALSPGWRIVAPSTPFDYVGLMNAALLCRDPVLVIEHVDLYPTMGAVPTDDLDYVIPLGRARIVRPGRELTILTYSSMVRRCLESVDELGVDVEIIDLRTLDRAGLDWDTIGASIRRTNNVLIVEQGPIGTSYGAMLADEVQRRLFDWLDQPVERVHGREAAPVISKALERAAFAGREDVSRRIAACLEAKGAAMNGASRIGATR